jgi:hypothetical protein
LEVFDDFLRDAVGIGKICAVFDAFVFDPEAIGVSAARGSFTAGGTELVSVSR